MTGEEAKNVIEQLRFGIPPTCFLLDFTVGRDTQIHNLHQSLAHVGKNGALLIHANYGSGKSHLLRVLREIALKHGFITSLIEADMRGEVKFNRMDTIFGSICKEIEVPHYSGSGIEILFDAYRDADESKLEGSIVHERKKNSNANRWDISYNFNAPSIYVALRAWIHEDSACKNRSLITEWLTNPENFRTQKKLLYQTLVVNLRNHFRDPRPEYKFYKDKVFLLNAANHLHAWRALSDLHNLSICSGYRGLILLVDEFEDVIHNSSRRDHQQAAFKNLFRFFAGKLFPGKAFFAVTPDFAQRCKDELDRKGVYDIDDYDMFDRLPNLQLEPININDSITLAKRIRKTHGLAYEWNANQAVEDTTLQQHCQQMMRTESPDKIRQTIISIVELLDSRLPT